jgi:hypothetical protein
MKDKTQLTSAVHMWEATQNAGARVLVQELAGSIADEYSRTQFLQRVDAGWMRLPE